MTPRTTSKKTTKPATKPAAKSTAKSAAKPAAKAPELTAADVEQYLREHPDFFEQHIPLLDILRIPHPSGGSISLLERQVSLLRDKHHALEQQLTELMERARDSERMGLHLHRLACTLMHADDLDTVLALTQEALRDELKTEWVSIRLQHTDHQGLHGLRPEDLGEFEDLFQSGQARCGRLPRATLRALFDDQAEQIGSAILMPLLVNEERLGVLALGSESQSRFQPDMGTYFVTRLGELLAEAIRCQAVQAPSSAA